MTKAHFILIGFLFLNLMACEGHFAGDRPYNIQILNGPTEIKLITVGGTDYLGVLNQNTRVAASTGNIQFYSLTTPLAPTKNADLSIEVPSNASDFEIDGNTLYVSDRNLKRILIYDFAAGRFTQRLLANGDPVSIIVTDQPQKLLIFTRASDSLKIMAVVCQYSGLMHFIRLDTQAFLSRGDDATATPDLYTLDNLASAGLYTMPRQSVAGTDDTIRTPQTPPSIGINSLVYLDGTDQVFVTASALSMAMFSFRFDRFQNTSNLNWNLPRSRDGTNVNGQNFPGSGENGFRAIASDGEGSVFAVSRADNGLFRVPRAYFEAGKDLVGTETQALRNTRSYPDNETTHRLVTFDTTTTDKIFPHVVSLTVNYCPAGAVGPHCTLVGNPATTAWVLSLGQKSGTTIQLYPKVYRVAVGASSGVVEDESNDGDLGTSPQKIFWYPNASLLYVANAGSDTITILDDTTLDVVGTLQN